MADASDSIHLKLDYARALVLLEWLTKQEELGNFRYEHKAEEYVVWYLQAQLEKNDQLQATFIGNPNYLAALGAAREKVAADTAPFEL
jgi:hypothetical protein